MIPSSEIRVVEHSTHRLVLLDPPFYLAGIVTLLVSLLGIVAFLIFRHVLKLSAMDRMTLLSAIPFLLVGVAFLTSKTYITLDYDQDKVLIERQNVGITRAKIELPFSEINSASVIAGSGRQKGSYSLVLVLESGETIPLGNYSNQPGHYAIESTINDFLASQRKKGQ